MKGAFHQDWLYLAIYIDKPGYLQVCGVIVSFWIIHTALGSGLRQGVTWGGGTQQAMLLCGGACP